MKRRLIVLRHAKSAWNTGAGTDHARPLNKRGLRTAPHVGEALASLGWLPGVVLSSDSLRTRMTVEGVAVGLGRELSPRFTRHLYHAGVDEIRRELPTVDASVETVLLVGHNPGLEAAVAWFSGQYVVMKTADCALLEGHGESWEQAVREPQTWTLKEFMRGRDLDG